VAARGALAVLVVLAGLFGAHAAAAASSSSDELVRQARAHEAAHENDLALRRYTEALTLDATNEEGWLGLGALRLRLGEAAESERVYDAALQRVPTCSRALEGRARARWALSRRPEAEADLAAYASAQGGAAAWRELASWYGVEGRAPAQLAVWRLLLASAVDAHDAPAEKEARLMVRALVLLVGSADPAASPPGPEATRRALAAIARRGG
jgi:cytochrome c-type biogenesis protein CcmH/NrfG